jgi:hypothetical protein
VHLQTAIRTGKPIDLRHWDSVFYEVLKPQMVPFWRAGLSRGRQQVDAALMSKGLARAVKKDTSTIRARADRSFMLHNPAVLEAIDSATMTFCAETNRTATMDLNAAIEQLRRALKEGIEAGEAFADLGKRVRTLFADPARAQLIATTESTRALAGGAVLMYERSGAEGTIWMTTSAPCPKCEALDGEERPFGEPFYIDPKGGPYALVYHAPLHPRCNCSCAPAI